MATITIQYDARNSSAKRLLEFLRTLSFIKIKEDSANEEPQYDPEFVKKINEGRKEFEEGKCNVINTEDLWK